MRYVLAWSSVGAVLLLACGASARGQETVWLDQLDVRKSACGWQETRKNRAVGGKPLRVGGKSYARGVGTHPPGQITLDLSCASSRFTAMVGIDDEVGKAGTAEFKVVADGKLLVNSGVLRGGMPAKPIEANLLGVKKLELIVTVAGDGYGHDHTDWLEAKFEVIGKRPTVIGSPRPPRPKPSRGYWEKAAEQVYHPASLELPSDRDEADRAPRRTAALLEHSRTMAGAPDLVSNILYVTATVVSGYTSARAAWAALRTVRSLDMNLLMTLAAV